MINPSACYIAPVIDPQKYGVRSEGQHFLVDIAALARVLFREWRECPPRPAPVPFVETDTETAYGRTTRMPFSVRVF